MVLGQSPVKVLDEFTDVGLTPIKMDLSLSVFLGTKIVTVRIYYLILSLTKI